NGRPRLGIRSSVDHRLPRAFPLHIYSPKIRCLGIGCRRPALEPGLTREWPRAGCLRAWTPLPFPQAIAETPKMSASSLVDLPAFNLGNHRIPLVPSMSLRLNTPCLS